MLSNWTLSKDILVNFQLPGVGGGASSLRKHGQARISDSGYLSHIAGSSDVPTTTSTVTSTSKTSKASDGSSGGKESAATAQGADPHQLSEQTIHAMLRPLSFRGMKKEKHIKQADKYISPNLWCLICFAITCIAEDLSVLSEDMSSLIGSPIEATESASGTQLRLSPTSDWSSSQQQTPTNEGGEAIFAAPADSPLVISKGPQKSEVQLRYGFNVFYLLITKSTSLYGSLWFDLCLLVSSKLLDQT